MKVLFFSTGCSSRASVAVDKSPPRKPKPKPKPKAKPELEPAPNVTGKQVVEEEECSSKVRTKNPFRWLPLTKHNISGGIHRFIRITVKSFSQLFVYKGIEELTEEMEIGFPTDVKHVTHIGLDGTTKTNHIKCWEHFNHPDITAFPSFSFRQLELDMAAQAQNS
ncbi:hypothetical protein DITRI_Ditri15bG0046400 [Diplodiscus trichospermus]